MGKARRRIPVVPIVFGIIFGLVAAEDTTHWATSDYIMWKNSILEG